MENKVRRRLVVEFYLNEGDMHYVCYSNATANECVMQAWLTNDNPFTPSGSTLYGEYAHAYHCKDEEMFLALVSSTKKLIFDANGDWYYKSVSYEAHKPF